MAEALLADGTPAVLKVAIPEGLDGQGAFDRELRTVTLGQIRDWTLYYTVKGNACIAMGFVLHSGNLGAFPTSVVQFNFDAESAVFAQMMSTFAFLGSN